MPTMTIAQALARTDTGITVVDTPTNIARAVGNTSLVARVTLFTLGANAAASPQDATLLASLGGKFATSGFRLTVRGSIAELGSTDYAAGVAIATVTAAFDTAANLLASGAATVVSRATSVVMSTSADVTLASLIALEAMPSFSVNPGATITLADTATNLLAITEGQKRAALRVYKLTSDATVAYATAQSLVALPSFTIAADITLTVSGSVSQMTNSGILSGLTSLAARTGVAIQVADTGTTLIASSSALATLAGSIPALLTRMNESAVVSSSQAGVLASLPHFARASGITLAISDTATALLSASSSVLALATATTLSGSATVTVAVANQLANLTSFSAGSGHTLIVNDTLANQASLSIRAAAAATTRSVTDTVAHLLSASSLPTGTTIVHAQLDGGSYTAAQATALLTLAHAVATFTLDAVGANTALRVNDTLAHLMAAQSTLDALREDGSVLVTPSDTSGLITASAAAGLVATSGFHASDYTITVADTGAQIGTYATALFGAGFVAIVVTSGTFSGSTTQLLDSTLSFSGSGIAHLSSNAIVTVATFEALQALPSFAVNSGVTLDVRDTVAHLIADASHIQGLATRASLSAGATVNAHDATTLAALPNFSANGQALIVEDDAAALIALSPSVLNAASGLALSADAVVSVSGFTTLRGFTTLDTQSHNIVIADTAAHLLGLTGDMSLATVVLMAGSATVTAAQAQTLASLPNFAHGAAAIAIADTAAHLLQTISGHTSPDSWDGVLAASTVTLSADATVTAVQALRLAQLGSHFSDGGHVLTISDSAANVLDSANAAGVALADAVTLTAASATLSADDALRLTMLAGFSKGSAVITVSDTADDLLANTFSGAVAPADHMQLSTATSLTVAQARTLINHSTYKANGAAPLTIVDTLPKLLSLRSIALPNNNSILAATPIMLSEDATVTANQLVLLRSAPQYALSGHNFNRNGFALEVHDTARRIAAFTPDSIAVPTGYVMTGDATVTAAQATILAGLGLDLDGNALTVADAPANLLSSTYSAGIAIADRLTLSANATVSAANAVSLFANSLFTTGGYSLGVVDRTSALLGLSSTIEAAVAILDLTANEVVTAATLHSLALLGVKFDLNGHTLVVSDTAAHLASLSGIELDLTSEQRINASTTVTAATAEALVALPNVTVGSGVMLTVQDSVANLIALSSAVRSLATVERLTSGAFTVTAADAAALAALPHFTTSGGTITVSDTIAQLNSGANSAWTTVATTYRVIDTIANIAAAASSTLVQNAALVRHTGDATIDAPTISVLATLPAFNRDSLLLVVVDNPADIAAHAADIVGIASGARVNSSLAVTAAEAQVLSRLDGAGLLSFSSGQHLVIHDSNAHIASSGNAGGVALATTIVVQDTGANLAIAGNHYGSSTGFSYQLTANGTITGADAAALDGLGSLYSANAHVLTVADTAAGVDNAVSAILSLGLTATVTDTAVHVGGRSTDLGSLGASLTAVTLTDTPPLSASAAGGLHSLVSLITNGPFTVVDSAPATHGNVANLVALGSFITSVSITDTAAHVTAGTSGAHPLQDLGGILSITLTDSAPVSASVATGLVPVASNLATGTHLDVSDTRAAIAAAASTLTGLGASLRDVSLTDGQSVSASTAANLATLGSHLHSSVSLVVSDTAAAITTAATALLTLETLSHISSITAPNETVAHVLASSATLVTLSASTTIRDTAAHVNAALDSLQALSGGANPLTAITLTDGSTPTITLSSAQQSSDATVLSLIGSAFNLDVSDTAAHIRSDLTGGGSLLVANRAHLHGIIVSDAGTIALTLAQAQATGVDDGAGSALSLMSSGHLRITGLAVADIATALALGVAPDSMTVSDTAAHIASDIALGGGSALLANRGIIASISNSNAGAISLTVAQITAVHVDDGAGSVLSLVSGGTVAVTGAAVADLDTLYALGVPPNAVSLSDTAAHIASDLAAGGASDILAHLADISAITNRNAGTISLTASQVLAAHVDDGAGSALSKVSGGTLVVTGATVAQIPTLFALGVAPASISLSDTAAHIAADLALGGSSDILAHLSAITAITNSNAGAMTLTEAQVLFASVNDGAGSALSKVTGGTLVVTDVGIADIGTVLGLGVAPASITISDTAAHIASDIAAGGASDLIGHRTDITAISNSNAGAISLTVAQITAAHVDDGAGSVLAKVTGGTVAVTGAAVADLDTLFALGVVPDPVGMSDTAAHIASDLAAGGASDILANRTHIGTITNSNAGAISLTASQVLAAGVDDGAGSALSKVSGGSLVVTGATVAQVATLFALGVPPASITISDTAAHIASDLALGASSTILGNLSAITAITNSNAGAITLTEAQVLRATVDDGAGSALSKVTGGTLVVTGVAVADVTTVLALGIAPASITVSDTAAHIGADLALGGSSVILGNLASITAITNSNAGAITLTEGQIQAAGVDDGAGSALSKVTGGSIVVTGVPVADIATMAALGVPPTTINVSDTAAHLQADIALGATAELVTHLASIGTITNSNAGAITLTVSQVTDTHIDDGGGSVMAKLSGGTLVVTGATVAQVPTLFAMTVPPNTLTISDTAAHIATDLALGGSSQLLGHRTSLGTITNSNAGAVTLTASQLLAAGVDDGAGSIMAKVAGGSLVATGATVAQIATLFALGVAPTSITVSDTAAHIASDLALGGSSSILAHLADVTAITNSNAGAITLTEAVALAGGIDDGAGSAMSKVSGGTLVVTGVAVADIAMVLGLGVAPASITIGDSAANILSDLSGSADIAANHTAISSVRPTNSSISVANATTIYNGLLGVTTFDESGLTVDGSASALLTAYGTIPTMLTSAAHVTMNNNPTSLTAAQATTLSGLLGATLQGGQTMQIVDTAAHLLDSANAAGIALATDVELNTATTTTAANATLLAALHAFDAAAQAITVSDTVANLLNSSYSAGLAIATTVTPNADVTVTSTQLASLAAITGIGAGGHAITVAGNVSAILGLSQPALNLTASVRITDTSANVSAGVNSLKSSLVDHSHPRVITLSDGVASTISITLTAATYSADQGIIDAITTAGSVRVIGTAAQLAALSSTLASDTVIGDVQVSDTASNILANLTALNAIGSKFSLAAISDPTINATEAAGLLAVTNLSASSLTISDTGSQIAAAAAVTGGTTFLNGHTVQLSADSVVTAAEALSLQGLTNLQKNGHTLKVWDTASHLIDTIGGYYAAVNDTDVDGVYLKTVGGTATVSPSTAASLVSINNFSKNNPVSGTNTLIVSGTATNIENNYATLNSPKSLVSSVVVSASTTVTDAVYGHLLNLGATGGGGVSLTVRDTAANIYGNAPTQLSGSPSITPPTWSLSGSASLTAPNAIVLGGLSGFSAGAFILTLSASASGLSVTEANKIGVLGASFSLGGRTLGIAGDVSTLMTLSSAAKSVVTPAITDTFAHVATMVVGDNLLGGTISITDSGTVTVSQASAFLSLLKVGGGAGIPAANVSFGSQVESVTDTLSNIQTLTSSGGWTSNSSVHSAFHLVVADTVANLINGSNTTTLATMDGTTFSSNQTTAAANAQTLYGLQSTIHFSKGSRTLTIQDTPAHLLDPTYADGEAIADVWQLSANAMVSAVDAESLLSETKFHLNHTLTVSDTSDNLLDGVLSPLVSGSPYSASVAIQLSGSETLDARTAARVVALPGFTNTGALSIQDGSSYLLNSANLAAETAATSVSLAGDESVSIGTATKLAALPHFTLGSNTISLASNDYADADALEVIADFDSGFSASGHTVTMTEDTLALTPTQYMALQDDNVALNGHALSALATGINATSAAGTVHVTGTGVDDVTIKVYASNGTVLSTVTHASASFDVTASEMAMGNGVVVTEIVGSTAASSESAPIIALERTVLTTEATNDGATFAGSGQIQVDTGKYVNIYTSASAPAHPTSPILVYDSGAHTLSMVVDGHAPLTLVTLGAATTPASLDPSEILIRHFT